MVTKLDIVWKTRLHKTEKKTNTRGIGGKKEENSSYLESDNPEEALRDLVKNAVHEGMSQYKQEQHTTGNEEEPSSKRRKE